MRARPRLLPMFAATLVVAIDVVYLSLIEHQGSGFEPRVKLVASQLSLAYEAL
jgi:hypothetical protein